MDCLCLHADEGGCAVIQWHDDGMRGVNMVCGLCGISQGMEECVFCDDGILCMRHICMVCGMFVEIGRQRCVCSTMMV